jgi:hypothetical protein
MQQAVVRCGADHALQQRRTALPARQIRGMIQPTPKAEIAEGTVIML